LIILQPYDVIIAGERPVLVLVAFGQGEIFFVSHLLWYRTGLSHLVDSCDKQGSLCKTFYNPNTNWCLWFIAIFSRTTAALWLMKHKLTGCTLLSSNSPKTYRLLVLFYRKMQSVCVKLITSNTSPFIFNEYRSIFLGEFIKSQWDISIKSQWDISEHVLRFSVCRFVVSLLSRKR
jgi:hypothetical protein